MAVNLGASVDTLTVRLFRDARFYTELAPTTPFVGTENVRILFLADDAEWTATITDGVATFNETALEADTRTNGEDVELRVDDDVWAVGSVLRRGA